MHICLCILDAWHRAWHLGAPEFALIKWMGLGWSRIRMEGLQEEVHLLVCLAGAMLALAKSPFLPDIPQLSQARELGRWSQAPVLFVTCSGWQEESDNEVREPPWDSFLPITRHLISFWSVLYLTTNTALFASSVSARSGQGLGTRRSLKFDFSFSSFLMCLSNWRWHSCSHVWLPV